MSETLLEVTNLKTYFHSEDGLVKAVDDLSFSLKEGHTLGIVGESGSGKSVTSLSIMRLLANSAEIVSGSISFLGKDLVQLPKSEMSPIRGSEISMIFQEPMTSLNPVYTVGDQVAEAIILHQGLSKARAMEKTVELFEEVGIPEAGQRIHAYPHEMSGGQKQRVMIAMALSCNPKLLIADEPTTALDVTIQSQILDILRRLRDKRGMSIIFITHDLGVIAEIADEIGVMYQGKLVEYGSVVEIFSNAKHPYTNGLLACRPKLDTDFRRLPTVENFMDTQTDADGNTVVTEKSPTQEELHAFAHTGRGRLLHPHSVLKNLGYDSSCIFGETKAIDENVQPLLKVRNLKVHFPGKSSLFGKVTEPIKAVDGIDFEVYRGQTLGLVGESGCGKTTTGRAILRLQEATDGHVLFEGKELTILSRNNMLPYRRQMQIIFQDPYSSLNPRMTVESIVTEPMQVHSIGSSKADRREKAATLLEEVGLSTMHLRRYPHEFSGGQRQRIGIARALAVEPEFIICDESVSALDVSVQAQVLNLLKDLQEARNLTYIFISHDLSVVKFMADMMVVMNEGKIVEYGPSESIYTNPKETYTRQLIEATPNDDLALIQQRVTQRAENRKQRDE
ncbi:MAG: ABC transporter ATP-binding protein [Pirellulaceae bacterium]|nr:ABC transporter ATP-binding protein [Pirellulaceae bacterium]